MEVILRQHVEHLGNRGDLVKVAPGFARNYLFPRRLALEATEANRRIVERERKKVEARDADERTAATAFAARLAEADCVIVRRVGDTETLYGSVTAADIAEALVARGLEIDRRKIQLAEPIKQLGVFDVPVKLHRDVPASVKVRVEKLEASA